MSTNGNGQFLESELIHRKVKVGDEWQTRTFPVVGGRLRLVHEENQTLNLQTEMVNWAHDRAPMRSGEHTKRNCNRSIRLCAHPREFRDRYSKLFDHRYDCLDGVFR